MDYGEVQKLWVKGLGYVADKHIYKYKDYSECVFDTQIESKEWLCHEMKKIETKLAIPLTHVSVLASWYGLVLVPFLYQTFGEINVDLYDVDEYTTDIAKYIWNEHPKVNVHTKDVVFDDVDYKGQVIINTSCEHMMDMRLITKDHPDKIFVLQSNDNSNVKWLHINCAKDKDELIKQSGLSNIMYSGSRKVYEHKRIMVIGQ
tara:strand:+ start:1162 stop:1770 length:609 start_codon:yes stop_codon:yes gene_type:complete